MVWGDGRSQHLRRAGVRDSGRVESQPIGYASEVSAGALSPAAGLRAWLPLGHDRSLFSAGLGATITVCQESPPAPVASIRHGYYASRDSTPVIVRQARGPG
jgi:hypothetical protein